jgi:hypothetical protein
MGELVGNDGARKAGSHNRNTFFHEFSCLINDEEWRCAASVASRAAWSVLRSII